jgi:hypothetical protein
MSSAERAGFSPDFPPNRSDLADLFLHRWILQSQRHGVGVIIKFGRGAGAFICMTVDVE